MPSYTTPEAQQFAQSQRNSSRLSAILIAIGVHLVIGLIFVFWIVANPFKPKTDLVIIAPPSNLEQEMEMKNFSTAVQQRPPSSSAQMSKVITANTVSPIIAPIVDEIRDEIVDLGTGFGLGAGTGWGDAGIGDGGFPPPGSPLRDRCTAKDRKNRLLKGGGDASTEAAVVKGLQYLKGSQREDGSWGGQYPAAMTGLALLAFLGHCETPDSREYGETVTKAIVYLTDKAIASGGPIRSKVDRHWPYEHAIGTYALCEAFSLMRYGRRKIPKVKDAVELSVPIIINGQQRPGGWVYNYEGDGPGDTSVAGWQVQALKAASLTGLKFPKLSRTMRRSADFFEDMRGQKGGFGYRGRAEDKYTLAGVGALSLQMAGRRGRVKKTLRFILDGPELKWGANDAAIYAWYYSTQAFFQEGGSYWEKWNAMFKDEVVNAQNSDGSWPPDGGNGAASSGGAGADSSLYATCLSILMLEVYYRYLPATK
ncbi:MAG: prenyltransferase/squalene oxidase repeat-containing protein [Verrucomicrobiota bacterium]